MLRKFTRKRALVALSVVAVLATAGAALAFFSSTGSGTGSASVGSSDSRSRSQLVRRRRTAVPRLRAETLSYTVHNPSAGSQNLSSTSAAVASSGGNIFSGGTAVPGCLAADFTATNTKPTPMPQVLIWRRDFDRRQRERDDAGFWCQPGSCQGKTPDITVSAS